MAQIRSEPSDPDGYVTGEKIIVIVDSEEPLSVLDSPWLKIEIGDYVRLAEFRPAPEDNWLPDRPSRRWRFEYTVAPDDLDLDGISISTTALTKAFFLSDGVAVWVVVRPEKRFPLHRVTRPPEPRVCTDERELATKLSAFAGEWDGTPFRVDMVRNFPDSRTEVAARDLFELLGQLAERIEDQLAYPIIEVGGLIEVPAGASPRWDRVHPDTWETCPLARDRGQIHVYHRNDPPDGSYQLDGVVWDTVSSGGEAFRRCGIVGFHLPSLLGPLYGDASFLNEFFHVLGVGGANFFFLPEGERGVPMSRSLREYLPGSGLESVTWSDIDALRCIFPQSR